MHAKQLVLLSENMFQSFSNTTLIPFPLLDKQKKQTISFLIEDKVRRIQRFHDSLKESVFTSDKKKQDIMDIGQPSPISLPIYI